MGSGHSHSPSQSSDLDGKDIGPAAPAVTPAGPGVAAGAAAGASANANTATLKSLEELLAKGDNMTPEEAQQAVDLLMKLEGEAFRSTLKRVIGNGAFMSLLMKMNIWDALAEVIEVASQLTMEVVIPTTLLEPAADTIADDFKRANEIYNPLGIEIEQGDHVVIKEADAQALMGGDNELHEFSSDQATAEELALMEKNRSKGRITGYWVDTLSDGSRGEALTQDHLKNMLEDRSSVVMSSSGRAQDTFAHEVGHVLGLPHEEVDGNNLMAPGTLRKTTGADIDKLTADQLAIIQKSVFIEVGRKGVGQ